MHDTSHFDLTGEHSFLIDHSIGDLDRDLIKSLTNLASEENQRDECNLSTNIIIFSALAWFIVGSALWAAVAISI